MEAEKISVSSYTLLQSISRSNTTKKWIFLGPLDILEDTSFKFRIVNQNYLRTKINLNLSISESGLESRCLALIIHWRKLNYPKSVQLSLTYILVVNIQLLERVDCDKNITDIGL